VERVVAGQQDPVDAREVQRVPEQAGGQHKQACQLAPIAATPALSAHRRTGRHAGHADILRELIDGSAGR
jgi:hypothetical protein